MKRFIILFLTILSIQCIDAAKVLIDDLYYDLDDNNKTAKVTYEKPWYEYDNYHNLSGSLVIPEKVVYNGETYSVTEIGGTAFWDCTGLTSIEIPNSVTEIGSSAFQGCTGLTGSLIIPNSVTSIGSDAFRDCSGLTSVTIGNSVTSIGYDTFKGCSGLTGSLIIPNSVISIGDGAFRGCSGLVKVAYSDQLSWSPSFDSSVAKIIYPANEVIVENGFIFGKDKEIIYFAPCDLTGDYTIPNSVTSIEESAFRDCTGLTSVTIGNAVTSIGNNAFYGCTGLTGSLIIPNAVTKIGRDAFSGCTGLKKVAYSDQLSSPPSFGSSVAEIIYPANEAIIENGFIFGKDKEIIYFAPCNLTGDYTIPNSVTKIGRDAFKNCSGLTSVTIPNSVTEIERYAFSGCTGLTRVDITDLESWCKIDFDGGGLYPISSNPLSYAQHLYLNGVEIKDLQIPNSVTSIGNGAFSGCTGLTSVTIPNSVTKIGEFAFSGCTGLTSVPIPNSVTSIGYDAFLDCTGLTSVTIPNSVTEIGRGAFAGCTGLTSVTIPNSVTEIGRGAFAGCTGLTSVTIGNSVTSIGIDAFAGCTGLTSVTIGNSVTSIGVSAFSGCNGLTSVTIPNSVTSIGGGAFYDCTGLTSVTIPNSVTSIGGSAFENCRGLTSVYIGNAVTSIGESAFKNCSRLTGSLIIPTSVTSIGRDAFYGCSSLRKVALSSSTSVSSFFYYSIDTIIYPANEATVENGFIFGKDKEIIYFAPCDLTGDYTIPSSVTSIGNYAFEYCTGLTSVSIPNSVTSIGNYAFSGCSGLRKVAYSDQLSSPPFGSSVAKIIYPANEAIVENGFVYGKDKEIIYFAPCDLTGDYTIPNSVTKIVSDAFYWCSRLTSVTIPNSVTSIGRNAFRDCSGLTSVSIGNSVTLIGSDAFYGCTELTRVDITDLDSWCKIDFEKVDYYGGFESNPLSYAHHLYLNGKEIKDLQIPNSVTSIGNGAFYDCSGLTSVTIPSSVTSIGNRAFSGCSGLTRVDITDLESWCKIDFVGDMMSGYTANPLSYAHHLYLNGVEIKDLQIPNSVTSIKPGAFYDCTGLTSVTIPNSVTEIGESAFEYCSGLTSVSIPSSVIYLGEYAYYGCSNLITVIFNSKETLTIDDECFEGCENIQTIICNTNRPPICDSYVFEDSTFSNASLYVPESDLAIYYASNPWSRFKKILPLNDINRIEIMAYGEYEMESGSTLQLNLITPDNLGMILYASSWTSSNPAVATVTENGLVTAVAPGTATITATYDSLSATCVITVNESGNSAVGEVELSDDLNGAVFTLQGVCLYKNATREDIDALSPGIYIINGKKIIIR